MKNLIPAFISALLMTISVFGQANISEANYRIYDRQGNASSMEKIVDSLKDVDVVFLGENHDDATAHYLQNEIFRRAFEKHGKERAIALSLEMFERDVQTVVDEYLRDLISENHFLLSARAWGNYKTDYKPLLEFAKTGKLEVIAANAPRRYVNMVSRSGRESLNRLSPEARRWLAPLPYGEASDAYAKKFSALMGQNSDSATPVKHSPMLNAQALWDATMAFSIAEYLKRAKNPLVVHLNGAFHTENRLGTPEHLLKYSPKTRFLVVTMRSEDNFANFDKTKHADLGDFVILTDSKVPRSSQR
ncbi:MAG TPA: ChaN family lipoprotein [Pyrinomonadaceae bacterium]|jgi:uncharacterized iron-regulated protein